MNYEEFSAFLGTIAKDRPSLMSVLVVTRNIDATRLADDEARSKWGKLRVLVGVRHADDIDTGLRADLALVADQFESMSRQNAIGLLARLRDFHTGEIILVLDAPDPDEAELRSLGFTAVGHGAEFGLACRRRVYRFRSEEFFAPRDWNTPENWAHPENFDRYRW